MKLCELCKIEAIYPISLKCQHTLCLRCSDKLKKLEPDALKQSKFTIQCPQCQQVTKTFNIYNLLTEDSATKNQKMLQKIIQPPNEYDSSISQALPSSLSEPNRSQQQDNSSINQQNLFMNKTSQEDSPHSYASHPQDQSQPLQQLAEGLDQEQAHPEDGVTRSQPLLPQI